MSRCWVYPVMSRCWMYPMMSRCWVYPVMSRCWMYPMMSRCWWPVSLGVIVSGAREEKKKCTALLPWPCQAKNSPESASAWPRHNLVWAAWADYNWPPSLSSTPAHHCRTTWRLEQLIKDFKIYLPQFKEDIGKPFVSAQEINPITYCRQVTKPRFKSLSKQVF